MYFGIAPSPPPSIENLRKRYTRKAFLYWRRHVFLKTSYIAIEEAAKGFEYVHIVWMIVKVRNSSWIPKVYVFSQYERRKKNNSHIISFLCSEIIFKHYTRSYPPYKCVYTKHPYKEVSKLRIFNLLSHLHISFRFRWTYGLNIYPVSSFLSVAE